MTKAKDYYEVLGVTRDADAQTIKRAYRRLAKIYHPDTNVGNAQAEQRFKEISEAYAVLGDREKRKEYDRANMEDIMSELFRHTQDSPEEELWGFLHPFRW